MKKISVYLFTAITAILLLNACGPSEEEQRQQELARQQAIQDSLAQQQLLWQQQMDSIAAAEAAETDTATPEEPEPMSVQFDPNGAFAVQVEAWRSSEKAEEQVSTWVNRGFPNAYVVRHGSEATGNVWFRVRLGRVSTLEAAQTLGANIQNRFGEAYWVAMVRDEQAGGM